MIHLRGAALFVLAIILTGCGSGNQATSVGSGSGSGGTSSGNSSGSTGGSTEVAIPANAKVITDIQKMTNWKSCSSNCAGEAGTDAIYSMNQGISSPSLSGSAIKFNVTGGTPWADVLWWKQVGGDDSATHFVYEISFYLDNVSAAQALEFNVNQNSGGLRFEYATQCDIRGSHHWRVWWPAQKHWFDTGVACARPLENAWNHLVWELSRNSQHQVVWEAVTLNGQRSVVNQSFDSYPATGSGIDVAFQMDSDGGPTPWSVWVDNVKLTHW
jgi:hypothetical protein